MNRFSVRYKGYSLTQMLEEVDRNAMHWIIKRLSGNDTGQVSTTQKHFFGMPFLRF